MNYLSALNQFLWAVPVTGLLMGLHIFYSFYLRLPQRYLLRAISLPFRSKLTDDSLALSPMKTLSTILAATLGTGNIIGVSTAIALGGPGALFWCLLTGVLGMATAYAESYLAMQFRIRADDNSYHGGPMYLLKNVLHAPKTAYFFALCVLPVSLCIGSATQAGAIASVIHNNSLIPLETLITETTLNWITAILVSVIAGVIILGGIRSIAGFCNIIVPVMALLYLLCCLYLLVQNASFLLPATRLMLSCAFSSKSILFGFLPSSLLLAMRFGIARGLFTNEAGLGTTPIAACASSNHNPTDAGLLSMSAVFWDTCVICALTGFVILTALLRSPQAFASCDVENMTMISFSMLPFLGKEILGILILLFAFTTLIGWSYYGEQAAYFLWGNRILLPYRLCYLACIYVGIFLPLNAIFELTDLFNACMIFPNTFLLYKMYRSVRTVQ